MKTTLTMMLVILLGIALGIGVAQLRIKSAPWTPESDEGIGALASAASRPTGPAPKVAVDKTEYDFGSIDMQGGGSHDFIFTNEGDAQLTLSEGGTSCRCTMSKLDRENILPGESTKVTVTWKPIDKPGPYQQTAKILTNDPNQPQVTLSISGRVTTAMQLVPSELVFSRLSTGETSTEQARLLGYLDEPLQVLGHTWSNAETAKYFDVTEQPLSAEELKKEPSAKSGVLIKVTVKPGLPQGPMEQKLSLQTNSLPPSSSAMLSIQGIVGSEIAVAGPGWNPDTGILMLGEVSRNKGVQRRLMLIVRGALRKEVKFKPVHVAPSALHVSLGQPREINNGAVVETSLLIDIPQDSPPANHLGSEQGKLGEIILETTHPQVPKLRILVRFAIEG